MLRPALFSVLCAASVAGAQIPPQPPLPTLNPTTAPVGPDGLQPLQRPNGMLMRAGTVTYRLFLTTPQGQSVALGIRTVVVSDATLGGNPGWLIAEERTGSAVATSDSVVVTRADLVPERWSATIGRSQLGASFTRDSVFGAVQSYQGRASFALAVPANTLLSAGMVERVLELLPLREGYHAGASLLLVDGLTPRVVPAEIAVERSERVMVGTREVDAWRVTLRWESKEQRLWIGKDDLRVVRTEQALPNGVLTAEVQG